MNPAGTNKEPPLSGTLLPNIPAVREVELNVVTSQLDNPWNFNLTENQVGAFTALLTAASMLLLGDIVYRVVVRANDHRADSHTVQRAHLLSKATNPILLGACLRGHARRRFSQRHITSSTPVASSDAVNGDIHGRQNVVSAFPRYSRVFIFSMGVGLILLEILFVYLATNITTPYPIDKDKLTAITLHDDGSDDGLIHPADGCVFGPISETDFFLPQASQFVCFNSMVQESAWKAEKSALVQVGEEDGYVRFNFVTQGVQRFQTILQGVTMGNLTDFYMGGGVTNETSTQAVQSALRRKGFEVQPLENIENSEYEGLLVKPGNGWVDTFLVTFKNISLPENFVEIDEQTYWNYYNYIEEDAVLNTSISWNSYLYNATCATVKFDGLSSAFNSQEDERIYLSQGDDVLVLWQRPRMSLGGTIILFGTLFIVWLLLVFFLRWRPEVNNNFAWNRLFQKESDAVSWDTENEDQVVDVNTLVKYYEEGCEIW